MQTRRVNVSFREKDRISVNLEGFIRIESGILTKDEAARLKTALADRLMNVMTDLPFVSAHISQLKVSR